MRIAIEATGCENNSLENESGFSTVVRGSRQVLEQIDGLELVLVAGKDKFDSSVDIDGLDVKLVDYTYDSHIKNNQKDSSITHAIDMYRHGDVDAVIAPGDTRGAVFFASEILGLLPGLKTPAIPTAWPGKNVLLDCGANPLRKPEIFYDYAIMGNVFSKHCLGVEEPLMGVIANGHEWVKGNSFTMKASRALLKLHKYGYNLLPAIVEKDRDKKRTLPAYFEGNSLTRKKNIIALTDGLTGNIMIKGAEGLLWYTKNTIKKSIENQSWALRNFSKGGMYFPQKQIKQELNTKQYAGAPLLGVDGNVMICHGGSDSDAISYAISNTVDYLKYDLNTRLKEEIERVS